MDEATALVKISEDLACDALEDKAEDVAEVVLSVVEETDVVIELRLALLRVCDVAEMEVALKDGTIELSAALDESKSE